MKFPRNLGLSDADAYWITQGPNSGGIAGWLLYQGHVFSFLHDGAFDVMDGVPAEQWSEQHGQTEPGIVAAIRAMA